MFPLKPSINDGVTPPRNVSSVTTHRGSQTAPGDSRNFPSSGEQDHSASAAATHTRTGRISSSIQDMLEQATELKQRACGPSLAEGDSQLYIESAKLFAQAGDNLESDDHILEAVNQYTEAATLFTTAANLLMQANEFIDAAKTYVMASELHQKIGNILSTCLSTNRVEKDQMSMVTAKINAAIDKAAKLEGKKQACHKLHTFSTSENPKYTITKLKIGFFCKPDGDQPKTVLLLHDGSEIQSSQVQGSNLSLDHDDEQKPRLQIGRRGTYVRHGIEYNVYTVAQGIICQDKKDGPLMEDISGLNKVTGIWILNNGDTIEGKHTLRGVDIILSQFKS